MASVQVPVASSRVLVIKVALSGIPFHVIRLSSTSPEIVSGLHVPEARRGTPVQSTSIVAFSGIAERVSEPVQLTLSVPVVVTAPVRLSVDVTSKETAPATSPP